MHAINDWRIWVDTAHQPPFDLMNGETCLTFGLAWDWLYNDLTPEERRQFRERRGATRLECLLTVCKDRPAGILFYCPPQLEPVLQWWRASSRDGPRRRP